MITVARQRKELLFSLSTNENLVAGQNMSMVYGAIRLGIFTSQVFFVCVFFFLARAQESVMICTY